MKPATILSHAEGRRLHRHAAIITDLIAALLYDGKPKRRRRRKTKAKATATPKAKKFAKNKDTKATKKYPVETTNT